MSHNEITNSPFTIKGKTASRTNTAQHNMHFKELTTVTQSFLCDTLMEDTEMSLQEFSLDQNANKIK